MTGVNVDGAGSAGGPLAGVPGHNGDPVSGGEIEAKRWDIGGEPDMWGPQTVFCLICAEI